MTAHPTGPGTGRAEAAAKTARDVAIAVIAEHIAIGIDLKPGEKRDDTEFQKGARHIEAYARQIAAAAVRDAVGPLESALRQVAGLASILSSLPARDLREQAPKRLAEVQRVIVAALAAAPGEPDQTKETDR